MKERMNNTSHEPFLIQGRQQLLEAPQISWLIQCTTAYYNFILLRAKEHYSFKKQFFFL